MKKEIIILACTGAAAGLLAGCGKNQGEPADAGQKESETVAAAEQEMENWLPDEVEKMVSETEAREDLEQAMIDYYQIPEEERSETRYYYNYVDMDNNGEQEVFAMVISPSLSGTGGSSALWLGPDMEVKQSFTLVNAPILVTEEEKNGYKELILERSGGGAAAEVVMLTYENGEYTRVSDGKPVEDTEKLKGTAILCDDMSWEAAEGSLTLGD